METVYINVLRSGVISFAFYCFENLSICYYSGTIGLIQVGFSEKKMYLS